MRHSGVEVFVGIFLICSFLAFGWLALQLGELPWLSGAKSYMLQAEFRNISGVVVGNVRKLSLNDEGLAVVEMQITNDLQVPSDSIVSVKSQGIIGDKYLQISLGGDEEFYKPGEVVVDTESSVDLESLISKFAFGQVK